MKKINCVIFDMDGVIIDSEILHKKAYYETFKSLGLEVSEELYKSLTGASTKNVFQKLIKHFNLEEDVDELVSNKRKYYVHLFENDPTLHLVNGVEEIIQYFYNKEITLVLASSSAMVNINRVFKRFNLDQYFTAKISGADLTQSKPHPEIFEKAAILGNTPKENCIVIEDSDNGIKAANDAGIFVFGYKNPIVTGQTLENADAIISDYSELKKYFEMEKETFTLREGDEFIELVKLLKLKQIAQSGGHAKIMVEDGLVNVNGEQEFRKRKKLRDGDIVEMEAIMITISR